MHLLFDTAGQALGPVSEQRLAQLYAFPAGDGTVVRANFVATLDGAATGSDGRSGSINNEVDAQVFHLQRSLADVVLVGAGTAAAEGYQRATTVSGQAPTIAVVSNHATLPGRLMKPSDGRGECVLITCAAAPSNRLAAAREALGPENVRVLGQEEVNLAAAVAHLAEAGMPKILCEGGPTLFGSLLKADLVDELALTTVALLVGGKGPRITLGAAYERSLRMSHLMAAPDGTQLALWRRHASA